MKKIRDNLFRRSSGREVNANEDRDLNSNSTRLRGSAYSGSTLTGGQAEEESEPWGLKELSPGRDPIVE